MKQLQLLLTLLLFILTTNATSAIIKFKTGRKGRVTVVDTAAVYDTMKCNVTLRGKDKKKTVISKTKIEYLVVGKDTLRSDRLFCTSLTPEDMVIRQLGDSVCVSAVGQGESAGKSYKIGGWFVGGLSSGFLLGVIGTGAIYGITNVIHPEPPYIPEGVKADCFKYGYQKKARLKARDAALGGGVIGTLVWLMVWLSMSGGF